MTNSMSRLQFLMCLILVFGLAQRSFTRDLSNDKRFTCQKIFTYGLWGEAPVEYELGLEGWFVRCGGII